ncbi:MAG: hypothetical protein HQ567_20925, partial [Candidatus Nealsonbacteria bacterium]|nr:hypothetical protein [Candidatus Nealsonbacteria bacterium]
EAFSLAVDGGGIAIDPGQTLSVVNDAVFASGTTLTLGNGATFSAGSGSIPAIAPAGNATIDVTNGVLQGAGYDDSVPAAAPRSLTKTGSGTFSLPIDSLTVDQTTLVVKDGILSLSGAYTSGVADKVTLDGGTFQIFGENVGTPNLVQFARFEGANNADNLSNIDDGVANGQNGGLFALAPDDSSEWTTAINTESSGDNYAEMWYGNFNATVSGTYSFKTDADDFDILWMDLNRNGDFEGPDPDFDPALSGGERIAVNIPPEGWDTPHTATVTLTAGQSYPFAFAYYENGGGEFGRLSVTAPGGTEMFANPGDAAQDGWWSGLGYDAIDASGLEVTVTDDSTLNLRSHSTATVGPTTIYAGTLTTAGALGGVTFVNGITVGAGATTIGLNPEVTTNYGQINAAASPAVVIAKGGNGTWTLTADPVVNQSGSSWEVQGGVLELQGTNVSGSRPIKVTGGMLGVTGGLAALGTSEIELAGGTFALSIDYAASGTANALSENYYQGQFGVAMLDPLGPGQGYLAEVPVYTGLYSDGTNLDFESADMIARSGNTVTGEQYGAVWYGSIIVGGDSPIQAGDVSFGTASDDGSVVWVDGVLVVDNNRDQGRTEATASVSLGPGAHEIYVGFYENGGGDNMEFKVGQGAGLTYGAMQYFNPVAQANLWSSEVINNGFNTAGLDALVLTVTDDSTILAPPGNLTLPAPTMVNGILTTTGAPISFNGVTIDPAATRVGFNPEVTTTYGTIANNSTQQKLTIVKAGPSTWNLDTAVEGATGTDNLTWEVQQGTLEIAGSTPLDGRPVVLSGGTLKFTAPIGVPDTDPGAVTDGMAIRFDASSGVATDASGVATWANTAPGADATYSAAEDSLNGGVAPVWVDNAFNGNAVVRFDGSDQQRMSFLQYDDMQSVLWVLKEDADLDPLKRPPLLGDDDTFPFNRQVGRGSMWGGHAASEVRNGVTMLNGKQVVPFPYVDGEVPPPSEMGIISLVLTGHLTGLGGVHAGPSDGVRTGVSQIGQDRDVAGRSWKGDFADIIIYDTQLTTAQMRQMTEHLAFRYGIGIEQNVDLSDVDVTVTEDSTLDLDLPFAVTLNSLTMHNGTLSTMGRTAGIEIGSTTLAAGAAAVGVNTAVPTALGATTADGVTPLVVTKTGTSDLILDKAGSGLDNVTFVAADGNLVSQAAAGVNPLGGATVVIDGGTFVASATPAATSLVTHDNAISVVGNGVISAAAGTGGHAGPMVSNVTGPVALDAQLELTSGADYELNVGGTITGPGELLFNSGTVTLSAADNQVATIVANGGTASTAGHDVTVTESFKAANVKVSIDAGSFAVRGTDLAGGADLLTVSGNTMTIAGPGAIPDGAINLWMFDDDQDLGYNTLTGQSLTVGGDAHYDASGQSGGALAMDGDGDFLSGAPTLVTGNDPYATVAWIKPTSTGGRGIVGWGNYGTTREVNALRLNGDNGFNHYWWSADLGGDAGTVGVDLDDGQWHQVVAMYDGAQVRSLYLDGTQIGTGDPGDNNATDANFRIGSTNNGEWFDGLIDGVILFDRVLTEEEVAELYDNGAGLAVGETFVSLPTTNLLMTADSTLNSSDSGVTLGDLTAQPGVTALNLAGASYSFQNVSIAGSVTLNGEMEVRGALDIGDGVAGTVT